MESTSASRRTVQVEVITNSHGHRTTPAFVAFTNTGQLVGEAAKEQAASNPLNTIDDLLRLLGLKHSQPSVQRDLLAWPFKVVAKDDNPLVAIGLKGGIEFWTPRPS